MRNFSEQQEMIKDLASQIAENEVIPARAELDEEEKFPHKIMEKLAQAGLMGVYIPEKYDGTGGFITELCIATEELSKACVGVSTSYAACALGSFPILLAGSGEQKEKYLPPIAHGEDIVAFCLTEAEAGSDAISMKTTAEKKNGKYVLNGTKQWITNAGEADVYTVIAVTEKNRGARGLSAFIVEKDNPGISFGKKEKKMGIRCSATREVIFEDCEIPEENLLGREGTGFIITMKTLSRARVGVGAQGVGLAQGAYEEAINYARERKQFDKSIASFQSMRHLFADMATKIEAARALVYSASDYIDEGNKDIAKESAMAKLYASDVAMEVTTDAVQVFGGYGYMREYPVEKMMRDAKILQIYEGTNEIQRNEIGQKLVKEAASEK